MRLPDPDRSRVVLIGTSNYADEKLPDLPAVGRGVADLKAALTNSVYGLVPESHCDVLEDEGDIRLIGRRVRRAADQAEDLLLVYFAGHGLTAGRRHELYLALRDTEREEPEFSGLEYEKLRSAVLNSSATTKIIVLDCCFSGRVFGDTMADPATELIGQVEVDGSYVLVSAHRDQVALILPGENYTAFTGRLLRLFHEGVPGGPELLTIDDMYQQLRAQMRAEGLPQPHKRGTDNANLLAVARNRAFAAPAITGEPADRTASDQIASAAPRRMRSSRRLRSSLVFAIAAVSTVAIVIVVLLLTQHPGTAPKSSTLSAAVAVAAVQPDRLTEQLLDTPFAANDVPPSTSASAPQLSDSMTGITVHGLVTTMYTKFAGAADDMWVNYYVFDNSADAAGYYSASVPGIIGYRGTGRLAGADIGDPTKCQTVQAAAQPKWGWVCLTLSSNVVSYSATESDTTTGAAVDLTLARDAVRQLNSAARATARGPFPQPPGSLQPSDLLAQVHRPFAPSLIPVGLNSPVLSDSKNIGTGLVSSDRVRDLFSGSGKDYTGGEVVFYVFDSSKDAQLFYSVDWVPQEYGQPDAQTGNTFNPSGFAVNQQAVCHTFTVTVTHTGIGECYVQWGDVVVEGLTSNARNPTSASLNMALTLARSGLLSIGPAIAS